MRLENLAVLYNRHRHDLNYHFKDLTDTDFDISAERSFAKLPDNHKLLVRDSFAKEFGASSYDAVLADDKANFDKVLQRYRFLSQTNLFFLCHLLEKYNQTTYFTHEEICNAHFIQKSPLFPTFEHFANQYTDLKESLLLVPRGGFKSSIDMADCVQWIVCYPAITIAILTGTLSLAKDFVGEIKYNFTLEESSMVDSKGKMVYVPRKLSDRETGEWSNSLFQILFAEHCIKPTKVEEGTQIEFQTPAGGDEKEPTIRAVSIEQALSGTHFCVMKLDDVVTNENSQTLDRILKINKQISINKAMLHPYGIFDVIGTWYDETDYYGLTIKHEEKVAIEEGLLENIRGSVDSGRFNSHVAWRVYLRAAWWPTEEAEKAGKIEEEMKREDWVLWFPERLTYTFLKKEKRDEKSEGGFEIKYLNNPRKINKVKFPRELLVRRTIPHTQFPQQRGFIVTTVDAAYSTKNWADYTVIITALIFGGRFYILNMRRGRFSEYELPQVIASVGYKWKPKRIAIEDSVGVKWLQPEIRREMAKLRISIPLEFCSLGLGTKRRSKLMKAKPVARLLGDERLLFLNSCEGLEEIYNELEKFTGTDGDAHDDIVSAISLLVDQFIGYADMDSKINTIDMDYVSDQKSKAQHDLVYCLGKYARLNENGNSIDDNPVSTFEREQSGSVVMSNEPYFDPLGDLN
jgi:hypothetical protein